MIKKIIKRFLRAAFVVSRPLLKCLLLLFFDKKYLVGRYFDDSNIGYRWGFRSIFQRNFLRLDNPVPWPVGLGVRISDPQRISFHPDDLNNFQSPGVYFQNFDAHIYIGKGSYIAPNVGIITANHKLNNLDEHERGRDVVIGQGCWIGMNAVLLPGVVLGNRVIVAAGAVVTKSFEGGGLVVGGNPAKIIKVLGD